MAYEALEQAVASYTQTVENLIDETADARETSTANAQSTADDRADVTSKAAQVASDASDAASAKTAAEAARDQAAAIADPEEAIEAVFDIWIKDKEREQFEAATGGACTIERNANDDACHMFILPRMQWGDLIPGGELGTGTHEAWIEDGVERSELLIGMYQAATRNGELVSQPGITPRRSINWDNARSEAQSAGFDIMGNWEWSAIALWCVANGWQPRGNTDGGQSHSHPHERGMPTELGNVACGSGPLQWRHNQAAAGIADLVGNVWEWVWGFKLLDGRVMLAPDNDKSLAESGWVDTGWDMPSASSSNWSNFYNSENEAPLDVRRALIMPNGVADPDGSLWTNLDGERFPRRGGSRSVGADAGLGALSLSLERSHSSSFNGLRLSRLV